MNVMPIPIFSVHETSGIVEYENDAAYRIYAHPPAAAPAEIAAGKLLAQLIFARTGLRARITINTIE